MREKKKRKENKTNRKMKRNIGNESGNAKEYERKQKHDEE